MTLRSQENSAASISGQSKSTSYMDQVQQHVATLPRFDTLAFETKSAVLQYIRENATDWEGDGMDVDTASRLAIDNIAGPRDPFSGTTIAQCIPWDPSRFVGYSEEQLALIRTGYMAALQEAHERELRAGQVRP